MAGRDGEGQGEGGSVVGRERGSRWQVALGGCVRRVYACMNWDQVAAAWEGWVRARKRIGIQTVGRS